MKKVRKESGRKSAAKLVTFSLPRDRDVLAAFGAVALSHVHLDYILRLMVKTLAGITVDEARLATAGDGSAALRETVRRLAKDVMGETPEYLRTRALLTRCKILTGKRNKLMHGVCAREINTAAMSDDEIMGDAIMLDEHLGSSPMPSATELLALAAEISRLVDEINNERRYGFIASAIAAKG